MSTGYYIDQLARAAGRRVSGHAILLPAGRHRQPDSELRRAGSDRSSRLIGANQQANYRLAQQITSRIAARSREPWTCTSSNCSPHPTLFLDVDRTRAQSVGLSEQDVANSLLLTLSSSFQINPSFWVNPASGIEYNVAVQVPQYKIDSMQSLEQYSDFVRCARTAAGTAQQSGAGESERAAGADFPLQQSAHDQRLRLGRGPRPRRRGRRHPQGHEGFPATSFRAARRWSCAGRSRP